MCGTRILLVDDEEDVTRILAKRLERRGYSCGRAANGQEAVEAMEREFFPIVVMDVKMPVLDGMSALLRIAERWPKTQTILLSGHADMQLAVQAMTQGAFGYLMKPVDFEELLFKIEDAAMQSSLEYGNESTDR
ncbi:response regulator [Desulfovibrio sp. SGI.169]|uniref:response regulator n=1 Tax=Desulfovibrio sp. SGI.169 TaxID=3420561 RepID=UPI003CFDB28C